MAITASKLSENPPGLNKKDSKTPPVQIAFNYLTVTEGKLLEIMTRANPTMARAIHLGYIFNTTI